MGHPVALSLMSTLKRKVGKKCEIMISSELRRGKHAAPGLSCELDFVILSSAEVRKKRIARVC